MKYGYLMAFLVCIASAQASFALPVRGSDNGNKTPLVKRKPIENNKNIDAKKNIVGKRIKDKNRDPDYKTCLAKSNAWCNKRKGTKQECRIAPKDFCR